jgi:site-specific DNA-methyltransferase (adenine-specific)
LGAASCYFYVAKPARKEKEAGLDHLPLKTAGEATGGREEGSAGLNSPRAGAGRTSGARNHHPTTKGIDLMRYLARLITRPGGLVLDPFAGSGTTGCAAALEGFNFIGIEKEAEYAEIARARIAHWRGKEVSKPQDVVRNQAES